VRAVDADCSQTALTHLQQTAAAEETDDARRHADNAAHRLLDASW
jgi:hypothetical protein